MPWILSYKISLLLMEENGCGFYRDMIYGNQLSEPPKTSCK